MTVRVGAVEIGGTNCKMAAGDGLGPVFSERRIRRTGTGDRPAAKVVDELVAYFHGESVDAIGVGTFGPIDLGEGRLSDATPKPGWGGLPLRDLLSTRLGVPVAIDSDVNAAVLGEATWGAAQGVDSAVYVTVGTGIGAGALVHGKVTNGRSHPEMGHMRIPQRSGHEWRGICPYHEGCWEGLASGSAIQQRYGGPAESLHDEEAWDLEAEYLAVGVANLVSVFRPERLVLGGGVLQRAGLLEEVRRRVAVLLDERYFPEAADPDELIVPPALRDTSGLQGALILGRELLGE